MLNSWPASFEKKKDNMLGGYFLPWGTGLQPDSEIPMEKLVIPIQSSEESSHPIIPESNNTI